MIRFFKRSLLAISLFAAMGIHSAFALPANVSVIPPNGARFLPGQRFDLRVEGMGTGPFSATLTIDGAAQTFTSGVQNTTTTDDISSPNFGGFNIRGFSSTKLGMHTISYSFTDATGTSSGTAQFEIVDLKNFTSTIGKKSTGKVKNIIIMLGDGMGAAHRTLGRLAKFGATNGRPDGFLAMDQFPGTGMITTHSLNSIVTDSAPGMACYTSGNHFKNGQEGVYPANIANAFFYPRVEYLSEYLHRVAGKSLGLVSTADLEDATPAANAVHTGNRGAGTGIVDQYLDESDPTNTRDYGTGLTVLMGGGRRWFLPSGTFGSSRAAGSDYPALPADIQSGWNLPVSAAGASDPTRDLIADFQTAGFTYVDTATAMQSAGSANKLLGLFGYGNMNVVLDKLAKRRNELLPGTTTFAVDDYHAPDQPMLDDMTSTALQVLSKNKNGFVLMVEGAHIDKQSHAMDSDRVIDETIEFDNAVAVSRQFADEDGSTLVIVLADHECSGFSLIGALTGGIENLKNMASDALVTDPTVAPARQALVGIYDAAGFPHYTIAADGYPQTLEIDNKLLVGYGASGDRYEGWLQKPRPIIDSLLPSDIAGELTTANYPAQPLNRGIPGSGPSTSTDPYGDSRGFFIRGQAIGGAQQAVHTAVDIPISAYSGKNKSFELFFGVQENTDVFFKLVKATLGKVH